MLKDYILGTEIAEKGNFHIANISILLRNDELLENTDYIKSGGITLLNKNSDLFPKYIINIIKENEFTDLSEYVPYPYFMETLENKFKFIKDKFDIINILGKKFIKVKDKKLSKVITNSIFTKVVLPTSEAIKLKKENYIIDYIELDKQNSLTWY